MTPYLLGTAGCAALVPGPPAGQPRPCRGRVERAGAVRHRGHDGLEAWLVFACLEHAGELPLLGTRPLLDRDRAVIALWSAEAARWTWPPGHPDRPGPHARPADPPVPLARGEAAAVLLARAAAHR